MVQVVFGVVERLFSRIPFFALLLSLQSSAALADEAWLTPYLFKAIGSCSDVTQLKFSKLDTVMTKPIGQTPAGDKILMWVTVSLLADKTYQAVYEEYVPHEEPGGVLRKEILLSKKLSGAWGVSTLMAKQVDLYAAGTVDQPALSLSVSGMVIGGKTAVIVQRWAGVGTGSDSEAQAVLNLVESSAAAAGESASDYCANPY